MSREPIKYDVSHIQVPEGREAVRKRPGMYIGSTGERGLHQLVFEIAARAVNEALAGRATRVEVTLLPDDGVRIAGDGPGIPFEDSADGRAAGLETQLTRMNFAPARGPQYPVLDFCGVGLFVPNALSSRLVAELRRDGVRRLQEYARGAAAGPPADVGPAADVGTVITFWPDSEIFTTTECSFDLLAERFAELAYLNQGLDISLADERHPSEPHPHPYPHPRSARFRFPGGVREMVDSLDERASGFLHPHVIGFEQADPRMEGRVEVALRWRESGPLLVRSYANSQPTPNGGTHVAGFFAGLAAAVSTYARKHQRLTAADPDLTPDHIGQGLTAVISAKLQHPDFAGSTRGALGNAAAKNCVQEAVRTFFATWLDDHPQQATAVIDRILQRACRG
ncbi:MAG TPA: hypothetical protein VL551_24690 [Actinospica sp.]|nr:hypothetical protein [Actinospica sp.]